MHVRVVIGSIYSIVKRRNKLTNNSILILNNLVEFVSIIKYNKDKLLYFLNGDKANKYNSSIGMEGSRNI